MGESCIPLLAQSAWTNPDAWLRVVARAHPILVHFPIALILAAALVEMLRVTLRGKTASATALGCCGLGVLGGVGAVLSGWLNADVETHSASIARTMELHRWVSIGATSLAAVGWCVGIAARREKNVGSRRTWLLMLLVSAAGVGFAGHLGGSMVWGEDFLFEPLRGGRSNGAAGETVQPRLAPKGTILTVDFATQVRPILESRCYQCHGKGKHQGGLRLDPLAAAFDADESTWAIHPGASADSEFLVRVRLGDGNKDRMPPKGPRLTAEQIELLAKWIDEGAWEASEDSSSVSERPSPTPHKDDAATASLESKAAESWSQSQLRAIESLRAVGARVERVAEGTSWLDIGFEGAPASIDDTMLEHVASLGSRVRVLDVSGTNVTDPGLARCLEKLTSLERLVASRSGAGDESAAALVTSSVASASFFDSRLSPVGAARLAGTRIRLYGATVAADPGAGSQTK